MTRDTKPRLILLLPGPDTEAYGVDVDAGAPGSVALTKLDPGTLAPMPGWHTYLVEAHRTFDPRECTDEGLSCDCPDFVFRHAGAGNGQCKHAWAAVEAGLIRPHPRAEPWTRERSAREDADFRADARMGR